MMAVLWVIGVVSLLAGLFALATGPGAIHGVEGAIGVLIFVVVMCTNVVVRTIWESKKGA